MPTPNDLSTIETLREHETTTISDALDFLGLPGATYGIRPLWPCGRLAGRARTVAVAPRDPDAAVTKHLATAAIASADSGDVMVMANGGRLDVSCWGGIVTHASLARGINGVVVDGACRDIDGSAELDFPVFGRATVAISARGRIVEESHQTPVTFAGVTVSPGDYVLADNCGVVFVPKDHIDEVLRLAELIVERESHMVDAVKAGTSVVDVMHDAQFQAIVQ